MTALSPSSLATASSPISAFPARTRTMRRARSMRRSTSPRRSRRLQTRAREKLAVRVGIATGLVVAGDLVGQGAAQEQAVVGDTPNLAARLQGLADAGGVVVSSATRRLIGDRFRLKDLGRHAVKGLAEPVEAYAALGVSDSESRFEAAHAARLTGFVGREAESAELIARQRRAWARRRPGRADLRRSGHRQVAALRLARRAGRGHAAYAACATSARPIIATARSIPSPSNSSARRASRRRSRREASSTSWRRRLASRCERRNEVAPLIASHAVDSARQTLSRRSALSPAQQRRQTLSALLDQMEGLARLKPVLIAVRGRALGGRHVARGARPHDRTGASAAGLVADHFPSGVRCALVGHAQRRDV